MSSLLEQEKQDVSHTLPLSVIEGSRQTTEKQGYLLAPPLLPTSFLKNLLLREIQLQQFHAGSG